MWLLLHAAPAVVKRLKRQLSQNIWLQPKGWAIKVKRLKENDEGKLSSPTTSFSTDQMHFLLSTFITITRFSLHSISSQTLQMSEKKKGIFFNACSWDGLSLQSIFREPLSSSKLPKRLPKSWQNYATQCSIWLIRITQSTQQPAGIF